MAKEINSDVTVIGAGLTGLVTAFYLIKAGKKVKLIEKSDRSGGVINSFEENGFIYEAGPNSGVLSTVEAVELFEDLKEFCTLETANKESKKRLIWKNSEWQALPSGPISAITTPLFDFSDKLNILCEPFRKKGNNPDESVADLVKRRLGKSFLDYAVDPFVSGIYAGNPNNIVTKYALPKLYTLEQEFGSFIKGSILKKKDKSERAKKVTREVFSAENGLKKLIDALNQAIGKENILLNCSDIRINKVENNYKTSFKINNEEFSVNSEKIVSSVGGYALPELLPFIPEDDIKPISRLEYAKVVQVILGFKTWRGIPLDAFGGLVPSVENRKILGVLFSSSIFKNRAPENGALLSIFMGGMRNPDAINLSDEEITQIVKSEILDMMKLNNFNPDLIKIFRYHKAIPQYEISSGERFAKISELENNYNGLILAGNIRDGIGMADRIKQAKSIADSIK